MFTIIAKSLRECILLMPKHCQIVSIDENEYSCKVEYAPDAYGVFDRFDYQ